jgi:penicillin-binding protein 1C
MRIMQIRNSIRCLITWMCVIVLLSLGGLLALTVILTPPDLDSFGEGSIILDRHGIPLRIRLGDDDLDCRPIDTDSISDWAKKALVAAEDQRFYLHPGIDPVALIRATFQNLWHRRRVSGASTLTTQVIRLSEPRPRIMLTKLIEAAKAMRIEWSMSKDEILAQHINRAPFGGNLKGIEAASQLYYAKSARDLTLAEAALLMGIPQSPARLRPDRHPQAARKRMLYVLDRMEKDNLITPAQRQMSEQQPLTTLRKARPFLAPHFCDLVLKRHPATGPCKTTLDLSVQTAVERIVALHAIRLRQASVFGIATVVLDVKTGAVRALVGSPDYDDATHAGMVNAVTALRSPGSALKPFIYAMALEQGIITPGTVLDDKPLIYRDTTPQNFDGNYQGNISAREALILSLNTPALRLTERIGVSCVINKLRELGISSLTRPPHAYGVGIALGGAEISMLELANAYACLAREGQYSPYRLTENDDNPPHSRRVFSKETAYMVADILGGRERSMSIFGHCADVELPRVAWKTGTSSGFRDAWTVAWNPQYVIAVWVGNPDGSSLPELTGSDTSAPIAGDIARAICMSDTWFAKPDRLLQRVCDDGSRDWIVPGITQQKPAFSMTRPTLQISEPADGSTYRYMAHSPQPQAISLRATASGSSPLYWFANGQPIGRSQPDSAIVWPLQEGDWTIACCAHNGEQDTISIVVQ